MSQNTRSSSARLRRQPRTRRSGLVTAMGSDLLRGSEVCVYHAFGKGDKR